jgi:galactokinase
VAGETALLRDTFRTRFPGSAEPRLFRAPGRVNLIGEHTDYNLGFVLPIALDLSCFIATGPAKEPVLYVYSKNIDEQRSWPLEEIASLEPQAHWTDYVVGVAQQLQGLGYDLPPLNIAIYSTVPVGSGLSSSAAIEVSSALALLQGRDIDPTELAKLAQRAEREFVGVPCGIMDQYVSVFGAEHRAIKIDCRTITHTEAALPDGVSIIAVNSMVKHELGGSAYATRVRECAEAVQLISKTYPGVASLRDVPNHVIERLEGSMPDTVYRRARHVTSENERVLRFIEAAERGEVLAMGRLFIASHRSLQRDYEVSCEELDFLVDTAAEFSGVYGARMTGAGFGGCTVNLVSPDRVEAFENYITEAYRRRYGIVPQIYRCVPAAGAGEVGAGGTAGSSRRVK